MLNNSKDLAPVASLVPRRVLLRCLGILQPGSVTQTVTKYVMFCTVIIIYDFILLLTSFYVQGDCCSVRGFDAAVLFLDISGFTGSMERFDNAAPNGRGIEKFWSMINSYYSSLLDIIVRYVKSQENCCPF